MLVLAHYYDVPYLGCATEQALKRFVAVNNCCQLLMVADHHNAHQLRKFCLHFIASGYGVVSQQPAFEELSEKLLEEV